MISVAGRFAAPELLQLGPPPLLASAETHDERLLAAKAKLVTGMAAIGIAYDVERLKTDSAVVLTESAVMRDTLRRREIDDAVADTFLGSAIGALLDLRAADYGVVRRTWDAEDTQTTTEPETGRPTIGWTWVPYDAQTGRAAHWAEDDESLRIRARLAWEALSVAGPAGAYVFHALDSHPDLLDAVVYGPETGIVDPGEVLVVLQGRGPDNPVPSDAAMDVVAARIDAYQVIYGDETEVTRPVRDEQSVRPLGAKVIVQACQPLPYTVEITAYVGAGPDTEVVRQTAEARTRAYAAKRMRIAAEVPRSGLGAAAHIADADGLPILDEVEVVSPPADVVPAYNQIAMADDVIVTVVVR